jgi:hypothetical protein
MNIHTSIKNIILFISKKKKFIYILTNPTYSLGQEIQQFALPADD